jgi:hypothetical protein
MLDPRTQPKPINSSVISLIGEEDEEEINESAVESLLQVPEKAGNANLVLPNGLPVAYQNVTIPRIHIRQIFPSYSHSKLARNVEFTDSYIICFSGPRGGGKTTFLSFFAMKYLALGLKVWLNYPLAFYLVRENGKAELKKAELIDLPTLLKMEDMVKGGLVGLDEYQEIASAYGFNSIKNRLLAALWAQIRKLELSFCYTSKFYDWVDTRTRDELDIEMKCIDTSKTPWGRGKYARGEMIFAQAMDHSGVWTGYPYRETRTAYPFKLFSRPLWGAFDSKHRINIWDSLRGVELDLQKTKITDGKTKDGRSVEDSIDVEAVANQVKLLFSNTDRIRATDLFEDLGIHSPRDKYLLRKILPECGVRETLSGGMTVYRTAKHK